MMKHLIFACLLLISLKGRPQYPGKIDISIKDTLNEERDCILKITLKSKIGKTFIFPSNYKISDESSLEADLIIIIEKEVNAKFTHYACDFLPIHHGGFIIDSLKYKSYKELTLKDNLQSLYCLTKGKYRLKVSLNDRKSGGVVQLHSYILSSRWKYLYVSSQEIYLNANSN